MKNCGGADGANFEFGWCGGRGIVKSGGDGGNGGVVGEDNE